MIYSSRHDRTIQELSIQCDGWVKRLETLEKEMMIPMDSSNDAAANRISIRVAETADLARSTRESILSLYGHSSYYEENLDPHEGSFATAIELQADYSQVTRIIDEHLDDGLLPGKPLQMPSIKDGLSRLMSLPIIQNHYSSSLKLQSIHVVR